MGSMALLVLLAKVQNKNSDPSSKDDLLFVLPEEWNCHKALLKWFCKGAAGSSRAI